MKIPPTNISSNVLSQGWLDATGTHMDVSGFISCTNDVHIQIDVDPFE